jgi:peptidoglycan/LPS O-acetylase OafA/YrhL
MKSNYTNLDLLRSLAVMSVVAAHMLSGCLQFHLCSENLALGQFLHNLSITGVMFFFVHTCLVLMLSMHRAPDMNRGRSFLVRRAFRIYPLCWATILLVLATGLTDQPNHSLHFIGFGEIAANLLLVQNILPFHGGASVIGPLWSLPWEVQMYLVLPFFFTFLRRFTRLYVVFAIWGGATLLAVAASLPWASHAHLHGTVYPPLFIAGMVAYKLLERRSAKPRRKELPAWIWPFFVLGLFVLQASVMRDPWYWTPHGAIIDSSICLALSLAIPVFEELQARWIVLPAQQIAKYSYGVYLLHVPAIVFVFSYLPGLPLALKIVASLALTAFLSFVSFHTIENPLILIGKRLTQPVLGTAKAACGMAFETSLADQTTPAAQLTAGDTLGIEAPTLAD